MQCSIFELFQIPIHNSITSNNCSNVIPSVLFLYSDFPGVVLEKEQPYIVYFPPDKITNRLISEH